MKTSELNKKTYELMSYAEFEKMCSGLTEEEIKMVNNYILAIKNRRVTQNN